MRLRFSQKRPFSLLLTIVGEQSKIFRKAIARQICDFCFDIFAETFAEKLAFST
jgi:hypothetical protein